MTNGIGMGPKIPERQPIPSATPIPPAAPIPSSRPAGVTQGIGTAKIHGEPTHISVAPCPEIAERPFAKQFEDVLDPSEREFLIIAEDIRRCGVEPPDLSEAEEFYAKLAEKNIDDIDVAQEMANAVAGLRSVSRDKLAKAEEIRVKVADADPDDKKLIENRALLLALSANILDIRAREAEELMAASARITKEKAGKGEDTKSEIKFFASQARSAKISGIYERFKFEVQDKLGLI